MTLTNKLNLPEPIVKAVSNDPYDKGKSDYTATGLLSPPRAKALIKANWNKIEEDVSDRIWPLMGQIGHLILERAGDPNIIERRFFAKVATFTVSAQADLIVTGDTATLTDYKFCSVWTVKDGVKTEWTQQANIIRYLASEDDNPVTINKANIIAIFRDWSKPKAQREKDYPQSQVRVLPVELWSLEKTAEFIRNRIAAHKTAESWLPLCTDDERWRSPEKFALMKKGNKRAIKLYDTEAQADASLPTGITKNNYFVEHRAGESKRCENYCAAAPFCEQFQAEKQQNPNEQTHDNTDNNNLPIPSEAQQTSDANSYGTS